MRGSENAPTPVHPHARGDFATCSTDGLDPIVAGTSPRAWGFLGEHDRWAFTPCGTSPRAWGFGGKIAAEILA